MTEPRTRTIKVRFSETEMASLQQRWQVAGARNCAEYMRSRALGGGDAAPEIAELFGEVGFLLNAEDRDPRLLEKLSSYLHEIILRYRETEER